MSIVTLTTDFGTQDYYVGAMKGALLTIAPQTTLVDLTHQAPPQDLLAGAFVLHHAAREFPPGTIHLAVVDPGVGSRRRPLAVRAAGHFWIGPDNGLFGFAFDGPDCQIRAIAHPGLTPSRRSATFHGRDLFAPAAAHLAIGFPFEEMGPPVADPVRLEEMTPQRQAGRLHGQVIHVDRFGNLVTNIAAADLAGWDGEVRIRLGSGRELDRICRTYADVAPGTVLALVGSADLLEISVNGGSAARVLGVDRRAPVIVEQA